MRGVSFNDGYYQGKLEEVCELNAAWVNGKDFNLELVHPITGFTKDFMNTLVTGEFDGE